MSAGHDFRPYWAEKDRTIDPNAQADVMGRFASLGSRELIHWLYRLGGYANEAEDGLGWLVVCQGRTFKRERLVDALQAWADEQRPL